MPASTRSGGANNRSSNASASSASTFNTNTEYGERRGGGMGRGPATTSAGFGYAPSVNSGAGGHARGGDGASSAAYTSTYMTSESGTSSSHYYNNNGAFDDEDGAAEHSTTNVTDVSSSWTFPGGGGGGGSDNSGVLQGFGAYNDTQLQQIDTEALNKKRTKRTWDGVFLPVSVSVFGVVLFIRLPWIVGEAGLLMSLFCIFLCYSASGLTTVSMAAISTNGYVGDGGPYMMISRCLGPQVGIVIGVTFVMANAVSSAMYLIGSAEIMAKIIPWDYLDEWRTDDKYLVTLVLSSAMLMLLLVIAFLSIEKPFRICCLLLTVISILDIIVAMVSESPNPEYGFTGPSTENWNNNLKPSFDSNTNFQTILSIMFPGVTGVMSGVCVSGELVHTAKAIPKGIAYAWLTSLVTYVSITFVIAASFHRAYLQSNFGILNRVGHPWLFYPGEAVACFAAVLAMLGGSIRVLQAMAKDDLMRSRLMDFIGSSSLKNATLFYGFIVQLILFAGDTYQPVSLIAAQIYCTNFAALNLSTFVSSVSGVVSFRPIYRFFNKSTALLGAFVNLTLMFYMNPVSALCFTIAVIALVVVVDYNVDTSNIPWGDASQPIVFHFVRKWLLRLDERKEHIRHWRPSIVMINTDPLCSLNLIHLANNLKKGGLFELAYVLKGDFEATSVACFRWKGWCMDFIGASRVKAFAVVTFGDTLRGGVQSILRMCGLGGMKANTVIISLDEFLQRESFNAIYRTYTKGSSNIRNNGGGDDGLASNYAESAVGFASYFNFNQHRGGSDRNHNDASAGHNNDNNGFFSRRKNRKMDAVRYGANCEESEDSDAYDDYRARLLGGGGGGGGRNGNQQSNNNNANNNNNLDNPPYNAYDTRASRLGEALEQRAMAPIADAKIRAALQRTSIVLPRGAVEGLGQINRPNMLSNDAIEFGSFGGVGSPTSPTSPTQQRRIPLYSNLGYDDNVSETASAASPRSVANFSTYRTRMPAASAGGKKSLAKLSLFGLGGNSSSKDGKHKKRSAADRRDDEEHQIEKMVLHRRNAMEAKNIDLASFADIEEFCNICADVNHVHMNLVIARNIDKLDKKAIERSREKVFIDLWLPDEDDAVVFLMGYSLSRTSVWQKHAVLRIVSVVKYNDEIEPQNATMRAILKAHRLEAITHTVSLEMETIRRGVDNPDTVQQLLEDEATRFELLNAIMKAETCYNTAIILCRVDPYQRPYQHSHHHHDHEDDHHDDHDSHGDDHNDDDDFYSDRGEDSYRHPREYREEGDGEEEEGTSLPIITNSANNNGYDDANDNGATTTTTTTTAAPTAYGATTNNTSNSGNRFADVRGAEAAGHVHEMSNCPQKKAAKAPDVVGEGANDNNDAGAGGTSRTRSRATSLTAADPTNRVHRFGRNEGVVGDTVSDYGLRAADTNSSSSHHHHHSNALLRSHNNFHSSSTMTTNNNNNNRTRRSNVGGPSTRRSNAIPSNDCNNQHQSSSQQPLAFTFQSDSGVGGLTRKLSALGSGGGGGASFSSDPTANNVGMGVPSSLPNNNNGTVPRTLPKQRGGLLGARQQQNNAIVGDDNNFTSATPAPVANDNNNPAMTAAEEVVDTTNVTDDHNNGGEADNSNDYAKEWFASIVALSAGLPPMLMIAGGPMKGRTSDW